jgi:hypothetical protein
MLSLAVLPSRSLAGTDSEIEHLLKYIETSDCRFDRNGNLYNGPEAARHIRTKYARTKRWIKSSGDFIRYAATESSMTGRPYKVICKGVETTTAQWLRDELARYREKSE